MELLKFAAIDIGSNAVRLLISTIIDREPAYFKKASLVRVPVRLGMDAFNTGRISDGNLRRLTDAMNAYQHLIKAHGVSHYQAFATSAMREAENKQEVIEHILVNTGVQIQIIDGLVEAELLFANRLTQKLEPEKSYLYVDVGGGSTEMTLFYDGKSQASKSFKIGTVRLLNNQVSDEKWSEMRDWLEKINQDIDPPIIIGTGGNINKIAKIIHGKKSEKNIHYREIKDLYKELSAMSIEERMSTYSMRSDRADVIIPASQIFINVMSTIRSKKLFVPKVGMSDGMIRLMYKHYKKEAFVPISR